MKSIFLVDVRYDAVGPEGERGVVSEQHMVDALSHTEAEQRIIEEMKPFIAGEFVVVNIKRGRISEIFQGESGDKWFRYKVNFVTFDEEKGAEKRSAVTMMVQSENIEESINTLKKGMSGTMADWEIAQVTETKICEFFKFNGDGTNNI